MTKITLPRLIVLFTCLFIIGILSTKENSVSSFKVEKSHTSLIVISDRVISNIPIVVSGMLDRIEDENYAVVLLDDINEQIIIPVHVLPIGSTENTWFVIKIYRSFVQILAIDEERTRTEQMRSIELREKLRKRIKK